MAGKTYRIARAASLDELEDEVNRLADRRGYSPVGGPFQADAAKWAQAMSRTAPDEDERAEIQRAREQADQATAPAPVPPPGADLGDGIVIEVR